MTDSVGIGLSTNTNIIVNTNMSMSINANSSINTNTTTATTNTIANTNPSLVSKKLQETQNKEAFDGLERLLANGLLTAEQVEECKNRYNEMYSLYVTTCENEKNILEVSKNLKTAVITESQRLEDQVESNKKLEEDFTALNSESETLDDKIATLTVENTNITQSLEELLASSPITEAAIVERMEARCAALDPIIEDVKRELKDLDKETDHIQQSIEKEEQAHADYEEKIEVLQSEINALEKDKQRKHAIISSNVHEPDKWRASVSHVTSQINDLNSEIETLRMKVEQKDAEWVDCMDKRKNIQVEIEQLGVQLENFRLAIAKRKGNVEEITRQKNVELHKKSLLTEKNRHLTSEIANLVEQNRELKEVVNDLHKTIEGEKKKFEKVRRKNDTVTSLLIPLEEQVNDMALKVQHRNREVVDAEKLYETMLIDQEELINKLLIHEDLGNEYDKKLDDINERIVMIEEEIANNKQNENSEHKNLESCEYEYNYLQREYLAAMQTLKTMKEKVEWKELSIKDAKRDKKNALRELNTVGEQYDKMKASRSHLSALVQSSTSALNELHEKRKMLENEGEILRVESVGKEDSVDRQRQALKKCVDERDRLRTDENTKRQQEQIGRTQLESKMMEVQKLQCILANTEREMKKIRADFANAIDGRNATGILLIERNDEWCILQEKSNLQESLLKKHDHERIQVEEKVAVQERNLNDWRRKVEVIQKKIPSPETISTTQRTIEMLEQQLAAAQAEVKALSDELEKPTNPDDNTTDDRVRVLGGSDPSPEQLAVKIEQLEERLQVKKQEVFKQELFAEEIKGTNERYRVAVAEHHAEATDARNKASIVQGEIRALTRQLQADISELSMYQAQCAELEAKRKELESKVAEGTEKISAGKPPTADAEVEWAKRERDRQIQTEALMRVHRTQEDEEMLRTMQKTTVEARPNAYLDGIGLPKPYGGTAPFKPTTQGAQMRHFRVPKLQEIEL